MKCSICNKSFNGKGNNSEPFKREKCCDECSLDIVVPLRIFLNGYNFNNLMIIQPNGKIKYNKLRDNKISLKQLQRLLKGIIEFYPKKDELFFYVVDEEGLIKGKQINKLAYELFDIKIVGDLLVIPKELIK